mmetsp:Transcript_12782/g.16749  ORF Transcript_12782/g.16749 Transcript_12782/m.16749 type:complete len:236 (+) Transcript_12782:70-777(+)
MLSAAFSRSALLASQRVCLARTVVAQQQQQFLFHSSSLLASGLPYHLVVGLPALSPTMDSGSLAEWYVSEGDSFSAGSVLAKIETDKASIDFEAQDDGHVAKILMDAGIDMPIGAPIMITVEEADDVAAFKDYVHKEEAAPPAAAVVEEAAPPPPAPKVQTPVVAAASPPAPHVAPVAPPPPVAPAAAATVAAAASEFSVKWGLGAVSKSPMAKTLSSKHVDYIEKYGSTGQLPL